MHLWIGEGVTPLDRSLGRRSEVILRQPKPHLDEEQEHLPYSISVPMGLVQVVLGQIDPDLRHALHYVGVLEDGESERLVGDQVHVVGQILSSIG